MAEILVAITLVGMVAASRTGLGVGNPYQIYFLAWFLVFFGYWLTIDTWVLIDASFMYFLFTVNILILVQFLFLSRFVRPKTIHVSEAGIVINEKIVLVFQLLSVMSVPLVYWKALELSNGVNIFTVQGYMNLRWAMTFGKMGYGWLAYIFPISIVTSSVSVYLYRSGKIGVIRLALALMTPLFLAFLSTGRTFFLMFFVMNGFPLLLTGVIRARGIIFGFFMLVISFVFIATMTQKGVFVGDDISKNFDSFVQNTRAYTVAPMLALSTLMESRPELAMGENTFRSLVSLGKALGLTNANVPDLVRDYAFVPDATNVYTVFDPYYKDYGDLGLLVTLLFMFIHVFLYRLAMNKGGVYVFWYAASVYPLVMQPFQDQYFSLLSTWAQFSLLYWLAVGGNGSRIKWGARSDRYCYS